MRYLIKNLNQFMRNERVMAFLCIFSSFMAAMVLFFSVGLIQHFQKQREYGDSDAYDMTIARAIVNEPSVILADEPTGALDSKTSQEIMDVFKELNAKGKTVIIVTHDMSIAQQCGRIIEIADGKILTN